MNEALRQVTVLSIWRGEIVIRRGPSMSEIAAEVAAEHGLTVEEMKAGGRARRFSWPRQEAMRRMCAAGRSTTQVGDFFGRDHTTVVYACRGKRRSMYVPVNNGSLRFEPLPDAGLESHP